MYNTCVCVSSGFTERFIRSGSDGDKEKILSVRELQQLKEAIRLTRPSSSDVSCRTVENQLSAFLNFLVKQWDACVTSYPPESAWAICFLIQSLAAADVCGITQELEISTWHTEHISAAPLRSQVWSIGPEVQMLAWSKHKPVCF